MEASLARLTKAYSTAMTCIGAMHKLHEVAEKEASKGEFRAQSQRLASAARTTFEKAILQDPLIAKSSVPLGLELSMRAGPSSESVAQYLASCLQPLTRLQYARSFLPLVAELLRFVGSDTTTK